MPLLKRTRHHTQRTFLWGVAMGVAIATIAIITIQRCSLFVSWSSGYKNASTEKNSAESVVMMKHNQPFDCERKLDALDKTFDRRRNVRRTVMQNITDRYKKETTKFDLYEPEAVCFTDERFGSNERYKAFGDGM